MEARKPQRESRPCFPHAGLWCQVELCPDQRNDGWRHLTVQGCNVFRWCDSKSLSHCSPQKSIHTQTLQKERNQIVFLSLRAFGTLVPLSVEQTVSSWVSWNQVSSTWILHTALRTEIDIADTRLCHSLVFFFFTNIIVRHKKETISTCCFAGLNTQHHKTKWQTNTAT